jgi:transcriptional regulatory protein LevR
MLKIKEFELNWQDCLTTAIDLDHMDSNHSSGESAGTQDELAKKSYDITQKLQKNVNTKFDNSSGELLGEITEKLKKLPQELHADLMKIQDNQQQNYRDTASRHKTAIDQQLEIKGKGLEF